MYEKQYSEVGLELQTTRLDGRMAFKIYQGAGKELRASINEAEKTKSAMEKRVEARLRREAAAAERERAAAERRKETAERLARQTKQKEFLAKNAALSEQSRQKEQECVNTLNLNGILYSGGNALGPRPSRDGMSTSLV
jgi:hypothetical protein